MKQGVPSLWPSTFGKYADQRLQVALLIGLLGCVVQVSVVKEIIIGTTLGTALGMWWQVRTAGSRPVVWGLRKGRPCLGSEAARPRSGGGVGRGLFVPSRACCSATGLGR